MSTSMNTRERKCFRRLLDGKSLPDFACLCAMSEKGWVSITGGSDDMSITPTDAGKKLYEGRS